MRRWEGSRLTPTIDGGVRYFARDLVLTLAAELAGARTEGQDQAGTVPALRPGRGRQPGRDGGELAAAVFDRFERRESLSEIVRGLRIEPRAVRALYHEWLCGLERGEQRRRYPVPPIAAAKVTAAELAQLLAALPPAARLSVARRGEPEYPDGDIVQVFDELGGFDTEGVVTAADIEARYGAGLFRIAASTAAAGLLWEVICVLP